VPVLPPAVGEEDDDFAYEDEHIEMEADNQEYEDLQGGEFASVPALTEKKPDSLSLPVPPKASPVAPSKEVMAASTKNISQAQPDLPIAKRGSPLPGAAEKRTAPAQKKAAENSARKTQLRKPPGAKKQSAIRKKVATKAAKKPPHKQISKSKRKHA
jgi:hypothetical protein